MTFQENENLRSVDQSLSFSYASGVFEKQGLSLEAPQMKTLGILSADGVYTNLGLLLSDQCPHLIKAAVFAGTNQEQFQSRREFSGSLLKQIDDAYAFLDMHNECSATFDGLYRVDHYAYPQAAIREALVNAVTHRDYSFSASILIGIYLDRIEITSIGGLLPGFSLTDVLSGISVCRNPRLADVFYRLDLIEACGTGLRKIVNAYPGVRTDQLFHITDNVFKTVLPRLSSLPGETPKLRESHEDRILEYLSTARELSRADVEKLTGLSTASANRLLRRMVEGGDLEVSGNGKNTRYNPARHS